jgi:hypothetical protein
MRKGVHGPPKNHPPCPGLSSGFCGMCTLVPLCKAWECTKCGLTEACCCWARHDSGWHDRHEAHLRVYIDVDELLEEAA